MITNTLDFGCAKYNVYASVPLRSVTPSKTWV